MTTLAENLSRLPPGVRPIVEAAIHVVHSVAPAAEEVAYQSHAPANPSAMWKLVRYRLNGEYVAGIGTFRRHSTIWFYRGRELEDPSRLLQGSGKESRFVTLADAADAEKPALRKLVEGAFATARR